ncbi:hypothetical protein Baya_4617 [Bagarius yarrelli]|uniref:BHLH domain-containing protein n=1 Tax=Bagarius yarrelli TaxID=175774 RepID=A0A556TRC1_BAGYA|nr:hypothetical protein Baya_4617 [Bagarius yarrelli]
MRHYSFFIFALLSNPTGQWANAGFLPRALSASPARALSKLCPCHLRASQSSDRDAQLTDLLRTHAFCSVYQEHFERRKENSREPQLAQTRKETEGSMTARQLPLPHRISSHLDKASSIGGY